MHNVRTDEQLETIFGKDGAIEALEKARDEKVVRFLGITGHFDPDVLTRAIKRYDFDTILLALNPSDPHFRPFQKELLPLANEKKMGIIGMKIPARGRLFRPGGITTIKESMTYVLTHPVSTVIVGCDTIEQLEENVAIAAEFKALNSSQMAAIEEKVAGYPLEASFFKTGAAGFDREDGQKDDQQMDA